MAWPNRIYVATTALGVFYTADFVDPSTQPTWTAVNTGLAATTCAEFWLDPFTPETRQYVMTGSPRVLYRRDNEGDWASILTVAQARILTGYAWTDDDFGGFCCDPANAGVLWAVYRNSDGAWERPLCILRSDDWGDTWTFVAEPYNGIYLYQYDSVRANGDNVFVAAAIGAGGTAVTYCSDDGFATWDYVVQQYNTTWPICHNPLMPTFAYTTTYTNSPLKRITSAAASVDLQNNIGPGRWDAMWFHPSDADHQRVLRDGKLNVTADAWANYSQGNAILPEPRSFAPWAGSDVNQMLVGLTISHAWGQDHIIGVLYGDDDVTTTVIAGASPGSAPYTDSIPYTCGSLAKMGIWAVQEAPSEGPTPPPGRMIIPPQKPGGDPPTIITLGGDVLTQAVTMPDYDDDDRGVPIQGDRAAWDVVDYPERHARDLKDNVPVHHTPEGDAEGDLLAWDDTDGKWESKAAISGTEDRLASFDATGLVIGDSQIADGVADDVLTIAATLTAPRAFTLPDAAMTITGGGTLALGGYVLTAPATGTLFLATGLAGGQTAYGGTAANDDLTLNGTSHGTKTSSWVALQPDGGRVFVGTRIDSASLLGVGGSGSQILYVKGTAYPVFTCERETAVTSSIQSTFTLLSTCTGDMVDGFGGGVTFSIDDPGTTPSYIARIAAIRDGADNTGALRFDTAGITEAMRIDASQNIGVGITAPAAKLHVDQPSSTGAIPVLTLDQADVSEEFLRLIGASAADNSQSLADAADLTTPGNIVGWIKIYVEDVAGAGDIADGIYWLPFYSTPTA